MTINSEGIQLDSFATIFNDIGDGFKNIYGQDISIAQDSPDGQMIGIMANAVYDLQSILGKIYAGFDPDYAEGFELDKILKLLATTRLPATKSTVDIDIVTSANVVLPADYTVKDDNKQEWIIISSQTLVTGTTTVSFEAKLWGNIEALLNTITTPVSILTEVTSINNPASALAGRDEESDIVLRKRRNSLIEYRAESTVGALVGKIIKLDNVSDVVIYENSTDVVDNVKVIDPHTIWVIAEGGDIAEIGQIIATDKTAGTGLKGSVSSTYEETFLRSNGTSRIVYHEVKFDRPTDSNIYIKLDVVKRLPTDIIDTDAIKTSLAALLFNISQSITATELYATIYSAGNTFIASNLTLSHDNITYVSDLLTSDYDERLIIDLNQITITEI